MIVGLFAEGRGDLAVITNILKGYLNIDRADIRYEVPEFEKDQTDLSVMPKEQHSSWSVVKTTCQDRVKIDKFFDSPIEQETFAVIHLDTAERHLEGYDVKEPEKKADSDIKEYCRLLRTKVIYKINEWLENTHQDKLAYAIAIEETDAWVLTIFDNGSADTASYNDPKKRLNDTLSRVLKPKEKPNLRAKAFDKYDWLSSDFRKKKRLLAYATRNESLKLFCESLEAFAPLDES